MKTIMQLFTIKYPNIQAGMIWVNGHKLASTLTNVVGLAWIGAESMYP
jgi:enoyl-[acyl-carrier protein] reductase II